MRPDFEKTYIFYGHLSGDSAHPSVTALNRYVVPDTEREEGGIDVEPLVSEKELAETYEYLCMAAIGVCVAVNQVIGGTAGGSMLNSIADRYTDDRYTSFRNCCFYRRSFRSGAILPCLRSRTGSSRPA